MPGATKFLNPSQVTAVPTNSSMATVQAAPTRFDFDEPVYLAPGQEYAVVLLIFFLDYLIIKKISK